MNRLVIIADDFTGALDTGVQFVKAGLRVKVCLWTEFNASIVDDDCSIYSVDCESRHITSDQAGERIRQVCQRAVSLRFDYFYKKTDSTLRGNIGSEIAACLTTVQPGQPFIFIPSYPKADRILKDGIMYVNGVRLDQSDYAADPLNPITDASASSLFRDCRNLQLRTLTAARLIETALVAADDQPDLYILDSDSDTQLRQIADILADQQWLKLTGGCAGFAEFLAGTIASQPGWVRMASDSALPAPPGMLVICGSTNARSFLQISQFHTDHPELTRHTLTPEQKRAEFWQSEHGDSLIQKWHSSLTGHQPVIIQAVDSNSTFDQTIDARTVAVSLAQIVRQLVRQSTRFSLVVFGGDTLFSITCELAVQFLLPVQEVAPGVVQSLIKTDAGTMILFSKAGGLGHNHVLHEIDSVIRLPVSECPAQTERN